MQCRDVRPVLPGLLNDALPAARATAIREHLATCAGCRRRYTEYHQDRQVLARFVQTADWLPSADRVWEERSPRRAGWSARVLLTAGGNVLAAATLAVVLIAALALVLPGRRGSGSAVPPGAVGQGAMASPAPTLGRPWGGTVVATGSTTQVADQPLPPAKQTVAARQQEEQATAAAQPRMPKDPEDRIASCPRPTVAPYVGEIRGGLPPTTRDLLLTNKARACPQLSRITVATRWTAARKLRAVLS